MVLALILFLVILIALVYYLFILVRRTLRLVWPTASSKKRRIMTLILTVLLIAPIFDFTNPWLIVILHIAAFALLCDLFYMLTKKWHTERLRKLHHSNVLPIFLTIVTLLYGYYNMHHVIQTNYTVETTKPIRDEGYKIAFISDLHMGLTLDRATLTEAVHRVNRAKPDIVVLGGDLVDERTTQAEMETAFDVLGKLQSTYGTYYVYGNHDESKYLKESERNYTKAELDQAITKNNIRILDDTTAKITDDFTLIGRKDISLAPRQDLSALLTDVKDTNFLFVVDHQPVDVDENESLNVDLLMSGHTHGGQIWPGGLLIKLMGTVSYGYRSYDHLQQIVSSGIAGWGYPIRTEKHAEYVIVDVKRK